MNAEHASKVTAAHLRRNAYLYVRQSSPRQVLENTESTQRQYALRQRAVALGWPQEQIVVIDHDLGQSGASAVDREGFQKLVSEVGLGRAGIVLGLEVSRLARNCADWHRLLEICAWTGTLLLDEDGLYDPANFNDRLLLGLKGTMSEAELHLLYGRLQGGLRNKASRGELRLPLPVGLVYDASDRVVLDPDRQVQETLATFFRVYERTGSATATVRFFHREGLLFPRRLRHGARKGEVIWGPLGHNRALQTLHNPRYAGAFVHGRHRVRKIEGGRHRIEQLPQEQWEVLLPGSHAGYISWEQYQRNQQRLQENLRRYGEDRRHGPAGEGPALLQGLAICGICGRRMTPHYTQHHQRLRPHYVCQREGIEWAHKFCQWIPGAGIDEAISRLLLELMQPATLEVALTVQQELQTRMKEADHLRQQQVVRARYEAEAAQQRYLLVDPRNRLVADALEAEWNEKLRLLTEAQQHYQEQRAGDLRLVDESVRAEVLSLADDFPRLWRDPATSNRDRKRMVRLCVEDVTLTKGRQITLQVRLRGGATRTLTIPRPKSAPELRCTESKTIAVLDELLDSGTDAQVAIELNRRNLRSYEGHSFTPTIVARLRKDKALKSRYDRLREAGLLTATEMAQRLGVNRATVGIWRRHGLLRGHPYNGKNECLYEPPGNDPPVKHQGKKLPERQGVPKVLSRHAHKVQHAP